MVSHLLSLGRGLDGNAEHALKAVLLEPLGTRGVESRENASAGNCIHSPKISQHNKHERMLAQAILVVVLLSLPLLRRDHVV